MPGPTTGGDIKVNERPDQLRRKVQLLKQEVAAVFRFAVNLPKFGGLWRNQDVTPYSFAMTTLWQPLLGYTTQRPVNPRGVTTDLATGRVTVEEPGIYLSEAAIAYTTTTKNRYVEWGVSINGADPTAFLPQEVISTKGATILSLTTLDTIPTAPVDLYLMCRGEIADNLLFTGGGWSLERESYID